MPPHLLFHHQHQPQKPHQLGHLLNEFVSSCTQVGFNNGYGYLLPGNQPSMVLLPCASSHKLSLTNNALMTKFSFRPAWRGRFRGLRLQIFLLYLDRNIKYSSINPRLKVSMVTCYLQLTNLRVYTHRLIMVGLFAYRNFPISGQLDPIFFD